MLFHFQQSLSYTYSTIVFKIYTALGCCLAQVESAQWVRRITLLQSIVYKHLHENSSQARSALLCWVTLLETQVDPGGCSTLARVKGPLMHFLDMRA